MSSAMLPQASGESIDEIERTILPSLTLALDAMLEAASLARPGEDAELYAGELRTIGHSLEALIRQAERLGAEAAQPPAAAAA
jgi:hypothetical protein